MRVVTKQEMKVREAFSKVFQYTMVEFVFCFQCGKFWKSDNERPEACGACGFLYNDYGQYCKPDIIIKAKQFIYDIYGIVRVDDEGLHKKNKKHRMHDYNQTELLEARGVKVFILYNEEVDDYYPWRLYAIARFFVQCLTHEELYRLYRSDKDIAQRFAR